MRFAWDKSKIKEVIMAVTIPSNAIKNLQQMEVVVAGPDDANRLLIIDGQFTCTVTAGSASIEWANVKEIFSVLVGPVFTRKQFLKANATASLAHALTSTTGQAVSWQIENVDADWDDESGQVELTIEVNVGAEGQNQVAQILGLAFHVTILAAVPAA
jgi:hypothetical protein